MVSDQRGVMEVWHGPYVLLLDGLSPEVCSGVVMHRLAGTGGLLRVFLHDTDDLCLNVFKGIEGDVRDLALSTVLLEPESSPCKENIGFTSSSKVRNTVSYEHDERNRAVFAFG